MNCDDRPPPPDEALRALAAALSGGAAGGGKAGTLRAEAMVGRAFRPFGRIDVEDASAIDACTAVCRALTSSDPHLRQASLSAVASMAIVGNLIRQRWHWIDERSTTLTGDAEQAVYLKLAGYANNGLPQGTYARLRGTNQPAVELLKLLATIVKRSTIDLLRDSGARVKPTATAVLAELADRAPDDETLAVVEQLCELQSNDQSWRSAATRELAREQSGLDPARFEAILVWADRHYPDARRSLARDRLVSTDELPGGEEAIVDPGSAPDVDATDRQRLAGQADVLLDRWIADHGTRQRKSGPLTRQAEVTWAVLQSELDDTGVVRDSTGKSLDLRVLVEQMNEMDLVVACPHATAVADCGPCKEALGKAWADSSRAKAVGKNRRGWFHIAIENAECRITAAGDRPDGNRFADRLVVSLARAGLLEGES